MEVRLLGPVEVVSDGREIRLGTPQCRLVLAALAVRPGQSVTVAELTARVWGDRLPGDARNVLQTQVSRLRGLLARVAGMSATDVIRRVGDGYLLAVATERVDVWRARQAVTEARHEAGDGALGDRAAVGLLERAVELRRGTPLAGLRGDWADQTRASLVQEWLTWQVERFAAELRLGRAAEVVGPLSALLADHPLDEPLAQLLMLALYRSGRQDEALAVYGRVRRRMVQELGDEPGDRLQQLHQQVLRRDARLDSPAPAADANRVGPMQLPADVVGFTGRQEQLSRLDEQMPDGADRPAAPVTIVVTGCAGVGKTALTVHWAHRVRERFQDGQLFVNLRGFAEGPPVSPGQALAGFLRALGVPAERVPADVDEAAAFYRSRLADQRVLVLLDNVADAEQVRPLLPGSPTCVTLVTSRHRLAGLVAVDGAGWVRLDVLAPAEGVELLSRVVGRRRVAAEQAAVTELVLVCAGLPLALRIVAANLVTRPGLTVSDYLAELGDADRLNGLAAGDDRQATVRAAFDLSYRRLPAPARRVFRLLGLVPGPDFTVDAVAALADIPGPAAQLELAALASAHLVEEHTTGRYAHHDLLRAYARECASVEEPFAARRAALARLHSWYLRHAYTAAEFLHPHGLRLPYAAELVQPQGLFVDPAAAVGWLDAELPNLVAAARHAAVSDSHTLANPATAWLLADALRIYLMRRGSPADAVAVADAGLVAAETAADRRAYGTALLGRSNWHYRHGRWPEAIEDLNSALNEFRAAGWTRGEATVLGNLGSIHLELGRLPDALHYHQAALAIHERSGYRLGQATMIGNIAIQLTLLGRLREAVDYTYRALATMAELGADLREAVNLGNLGEIYRQLGEFGHALCYYQRARDRYRKVGDRTGEGSVQYCLAMLHSELGQQDLAREQALAAQQLLRDTGHRRHQAIAQLALAQVCRQSGDPTGARVAGRQAQELAEAAGDLEVRIGALIERALLGTDAPGDDLAQASADQALELSRNAGFRLLEGRALTASAAVRLATGDLPQAIEQGEQALAIHRQTGHRPGQAHTHDLLARAHTYAGDADAAGRHRERATRLFAELGIPRPSDAG